MSEMPTHSMAERCADCAFKSGTTPQRTALQPEKAKLCVLSGTMFFCHEDPGTPGSSSVLCKGFVDAFAAKMRDGYYDQLPEWKKNLYMKMLDAIQMAEDGENPDLIKMIREVEASR